MKITDLLTFPEITSGRISLSLLSQTHGTKRKTKYRKITFHQPYRELSPPRPVASCYCLNRQWKQMEVKLTSLLAATEKYVYKEHIKSPKYFTFWGKRLSTQLNQTVLQKTHVSEFWFSPPFAHSSLHKNACWIMTGILRSSISYLLHEISFKQYICKISRVNIHIEVRYP